MNFRVIAFGHFDVIVKYNFHQNEPVTDAVEAIKQLAIEKHGQQLPTDARICVYAQV